MKPDSPTSTKVRRLRDPRFRRQGWTLIELLGVLTVLAIISAIFTPVLLRDLERIARTVEERELSRIGAALEEGIRRKRQIPDALEWARLAGDSLGRRTEEILTNSRGGRRYWVIDPRLRLGPAPGSTLPFRQTLAGSAQPVNARVVVVSSLGDPPPSFIRDGIAASEARFDALWNAPIGSTPPGWSWAGRPEDLNLLRIDLTPLFVQVVINGSSETPAGRIALDSDNTNRVASGVAQFWYLQDTVLRLQGPDGTTQSSLIVQTPISIGFERGSWRRRHSFLTSSGHFNGTSVDEAADRFLSAPAHPRGLAPTLVWQASSNYFASYLNWARNGFPRNGPWPDQLNAAAERLGTMTAGLVQEP